MSWSDSSPGYHKTLDDSVKFLSEIPFDPHSADILNTMLNHCANYYAEIWPLESTVLTRKACEALLSSQKGLKEDFHTAHKTGSYENIRSRPEFHVEKSSHHDILGLHHAYSKPFRGQAASNFVAFLLKADEEVQQSEIILYRRMISVVQSSGTGKSRMLTEIGEEIFTLPICLRCPGGATYPPSDEEVCKYFAEFTSNENDLSLKAHTAIACFLGAAHMIMLKWLTEKKARLLNQADLRASWHRLMEKEVGREERKSFFHEVVQTARKMTNTATNYLSSRRNKNFGVEPENIDIEDFARKCYTEHAADAITDLVSFVTGLTPEKPLFVLYIDEARELKVSLWILLRLLGYQEKLTSMWIVLMDTKSSLSYFHPPPQNTSLRFRKGLKQLMKPFIGVGFDQNAIYPGGVHVATTIGDLQSVEHLSTYGRPLWNAQFRQGEEDKLIDLAICKLANGPFDCTNKHHVLAVLSQRVCLDLVMSSTEAMELADHSIENHMRLLVGFTENGYKFFTKSPSEPMLALAAAELLYSQPFQAETTTTSYAASLGVALKTLNKSLCGAGLVDKGLLGELAGRILLLLARDMAAPRSGRIAENLLMPISVMAFLNQLLGNEGWCQPYEAEYTSAFSKTFMNFTHWILTSDPLPAPPSRQLLENLWARGAALQCCFNQEAIDFLIVTYSGPIGATDIFDPTKLSAIVVQIKNKGQADTNAELGTQPIGVPRNAPQPLPYIAMLLEFGNNFSTNSQIKITVPKYLGPFSTLENEYISAVQCLRQYGTIVDANETVKQRRDPAKVNLRKTVQDKWLAMNEYNRFTITIRGASSDEYGGLKEAKLKEQFATLLSLTMPSPTAQDIAIQHTMPLERLGKTSAHTAWMKDYGGSRDEEMDWTG